MTAPLTFLFTDLENSTPMWERFPDEMRSAMAQHDALLREAVENQSGRVIKSTGDGIYAVFDSGGDAANAALSAQQAINGTLWPEAIGSLKVRMGLHTGQSQGRDGDYFGVEVSRAARIMGLAYGGQVLLSEACAILLRGQLPPQASLADLGEHRLKGLSVPEKLFQLCHPDLLAEFPELKSLGAYKHNLRVQLTSFVGRENEISQILSNLSHTHLLTLLGPGGTGKTRLMLQAAEEVIENYTDGVWLVELAQLTDPGLIAERIAAALNVQEQTGRSLTAVLTDYLHYKDLLLLLDNVEHLVRECAELVQHLLVHCPKLTILVTGREALFIDGEITLQIPSLSLPDAYEAANPEIVCRSEGVQLFMARAQSIRPDFDLTFENAAAIVEIVRRLDGIPLALELAASRLRMLTVEQISARLNDRFRLLTGGRRTALPRQQTLQALIDWSWNLLEEKERILLRRLSVFSGGWSIEAAEMVAQDELLDEFEVFDTLEQLINKSLVTVAYPQKQEARYGMLESIRQYASDRLLEAGEGEALRNRHAQYFVKFAEQAGPHLVLSSMLPWVERIELELDNLRAVIAWTQEDMPELALVICGELLYGEINWLHPKEACSWLKPTIENSRGLLNQEHSSVLIEAFIKALIGLCIAEGTQGNRNASLSAAQECIDLAYSVGAYEHMLYAIQCKHLDMVYSPTPEAMADIEAAIKIGSENGVEPRALAWCLGMSGFSLIVQGNAKLGQPRVQEALSTLRKINNPRINAGLYRFQGMLEKLQGDLEAAKKSHLLSIENYEKLKSQQNVLRGQSELAHILRENGEYAEAKFYYRKSLAGWLEFGHLAAVAHDLECMAYISIIYAEYDHAAKLLGAARETRYQNQAETTQPKEIADLKQAMEQLAAAMGKAERDQFLAEGSRIPLDQAVALALKEQP